MPKHNGLATIAEMFVLNLQISVPLTNKELLPYYSANLNKFLFVTVKLIEYIFSAVKVLTNPCVGPLPSTNISFFLLSIWIEVLISAPKTNTFWPNSPPVNEKRDLLSNPIP